MWLVLAVTLVAAESTCPDKTVSTYKLTVVDTKPKTSGCAYSVTLTTGTCTHTTPSLNETRSGYICINSTQTAACNNYNKESLTGTVFMTCGKTTTPKDITTLKSFAHGVNTAFTSDLADGDVMLGLYCNDTLVSTIPGCSNSLGYGMSMVGSVIVAAVLVFAAI